MSCIKIKMHLISKKLYYIVQCTAVVFNVSRYTNIVHTIAAASDI